MPSLRIRCPALVALAVATALPCQESERSLTGRLPADTLFALELGDPLGSARRALALVEALPDPPTRLRAGLTLLPLAARAALGGVAWEDAILAFAPHRAVLALVAVEGAPVPVFVAELDPVDRADGLRSRLLARFAANAEVREAGGHLLASVAPTALDSVARALRGESAQLASHPWFADRTGPVPTSIDLRAWFNLDALRALDRDARTLWARLDGGGRFILGPLAAAIDDAQRLEVGVSFGAAAVEITALADGSPFAPDPAHDAIAAVLFGAGRASRSLPPSPAGTLATVALDRGLRGMFAHTDELFGEDAAVGTKSFLSIADLLVGGSFVDELLPTLGEPWTLFVTDAPPPDDEGGPGLDLPGFVLVAGIDDRARAEPLLRRGLGTFAVAAGAERSRKGQVPFALRTWREDGDALVLSFEPRAWRGPEPAPVDMRFSPTLVLGADHLVFGSTADAAERAVRALRAGPGTTDVIRGDRLQVDPSAIARYLGRNLELAVLDDVLKRGVAPRTARREFGDVMAVLAGIANLELELEHGEGTSRLVLRAALRTVAEAGEVKR